MNSRNTIIAIFAMLSASLAFAEDFKTISGKEYKDATVSRVEADGIVIKTKTGLSKIYFVELPKEVQERFHYDAEKAAVAQKLAAESQKKQAEPTAEPEIAIIFALANRVGDKVKAVLISSEMLKAKNQEEQIAVVKNSDLYKRGYAKQSTAVKITISDAERDFAAARSELLQQVRVSQDAVKIAIAAGVQVQRS